MALGYDFTYFGGSKVPGDYKVLRVSRLGIVIMVLGRFSSPSSSSC